MSREIFVVAAKRTAIGAFGGSLKDEQPADLGAAVTRAALASAGVSAHQVDHLIFGQVIPTSPADAYLARVVAIRSGIPVDIPSLTLNRLCGSGLQAILTAANAIALGDAEIAVGGGAEVMSRAPFYAPAMRFGQKMGDAVLIDGLTGALEDPFGKFQMGITAENIATLHGVDRTQQDALALESQKRAARAVADGLFSSQIVPIQVRQHRETVIFETDEYVRSNATIADLSKLRPAFRKDGSVTAGNSSGINDGASAMVLASTKAVQNFGLKPMARLTAYGHAGVDPDYMGMGTVPATRKALSRAGLEVADLDIVESNEAFAAQACAVANELGFDPKRTNPNGSGISLGHPVGATGAIIATKLVHELDRTSSRHGLATMCIGGGQGIAAIFERV